MYVFNLPLASSTTTLSSSLNPSQYNQNVTFTATVTPITATGTVTFKFDGTTLVTTTLSGGAATYVTSTLSVGQHSVVATYNGDSNLFGSISATLTQTITCNPLLVNSTADDNSCGTLRRAVLTASTGPTKTITISLTAGSVISLTSGLTLTERDHHHDDGRQRTGWRAGHHHSG